MGSIHLFALYAVAPFVTIACDIWGCRITGFVGGLVCVIGLVASSFVTRLYLLFVTYGVLFGIGASLAHITTFRIISLWFDRLDFVSEWCIISCSSTFFLPLYKGCGSQKIESSSSLLCLNCDIIELCEVWERGVGEGHWDCGVAVILRDFLERFSIHCHKTRTKAIWKANHRKENMTISQWNIKLKTRKLSDARENASDHVVIGFSQFDSDWFRKWCEFSRPITKRSKAKAKPSRVTFATQSKITFVHYLGE